MILHMSRNQQVPHLQQSRKLQLQKLYFSSRGLNKLSHNQITISFYKLSSSTFITGRVEYSITIADVTETIDVASGDLGGLSR